MTNSPTHYQDFAPCEAVQYDGTNADLCHRLVGGYIVTAHPGQRVQFAVSRDHWPEAEIGDWLVRRVGDTRVTVQDHEPARVVGWEWATTWGLDKWPTGTPIPEDQARRIIAMYTGDGMMLARRPIVETHDGQQWVGPWAEVTE